ncbi:MAG TPA: 50S ribosomal protein L25 [Phycisphaerales bacterium]|nr:50S ribosomal protein L25 [Phycisphaerales bacterium]HCD30858.1 50S ribosomal protein L25 [Phycisphaerales bacterium]|tara:strand:- start:89720 stop:90358 length:639 start_codon:yes stop_codon:yes gene_type:complete
MSTATIPVIEATVRERTGTRYTARLRKEGRLPVVVYGHGLDPLHLSVDNDEINELLHQHAHLLNVKVDGKEETVVLKDAQWDHMSSHIIHLDLARVNLSEEVTVEVDLVFTGDAIGLKTAGAIIEHPLSTLEITCKASDIPEMIKVDVSALEAGESLSVADLKLPAGIVAATDEEAVVAAVQVMAEVPDEDTEAAGDEPEVIGRPAKEEDED